MKWPKIAEGKRVKLLRIIPSMERNGPILFPCSCIECPLHYNTFQGLHSTGKETTKWATWRGRKARVLEVSSMCGGCRNGKHYPGQQ